MDRPSRPSVSPRGDASPRTSLRRLLPVARSLLINIAGPWAVYRLVLAARPAQPLLALLAAILVPACDLAVIYARRKRLEIIALIAVVQLLVSIVINLASHSLQTALDGHALQPGVLGLVFAASAAIGRPLIAPLARQTVGGDDPARQAAFEAHSRRPAVQRSFQRLTLLWAAYLCAQSLVLSISARVLSAVGYLLLSALFTYLLNALVIWATIRWGRRRARAAGLAA